MQTFRKLRPFRMRARWSTLPWKRSGRSIKYPPTGRDAHDVLRYKERFAMWWTLPRLQGKSLLKLTTARDLLVLPSIQSMHPKLKGCTISGPPARSQAIGQGARETSGVSRVPWIMTGKESQPSTHKIANTEPAISNQFGRGFPLVSGSDSLESSGRR